MSGSPIEVADILRAHGEAYLSANENGTPLEHRRVLKDLTACRSPVLGGQVKRCETCGHTEVLFHSCRNRHCPKCQAAARAEWFDARAAELLTGVPYYHVVFTLPEPLAQLGLQNKRILYGILFRAVSETLQTIGRDPAHLGAQIGFLAVLHTWGQTLHHHPHVHSVIPGGGISPAGDSWVSCRKGFFLPVRVLSSLFKKKFLCYLKAARENAKLSFHGQLTHLREETTWKSFASGLYDTDWVVYAKPPFGSPEHVLKYLARYTHRVAISNQRLLALENGQVTFRNKDYAHGNRKRIMTLEAVEFIRRFLLHTLPPNFMRIRHYGFLANRNRRQALPLCRTLLGIDTERSENPGGRDHAPELSLQAAPQRCPTCRQGHMAFIETIAAGQKWPSELADLLQPWDTS